MGGRSATVGASLPLLALEDRLLHALEATAEWLEPLVVGDHVQLVAAYGGEHHVGDGVRRQVTADELDRRRRRLALVAERRRGVVRRLADPRLHAHRALPRHADAGGPWILGQPFRQD